MLEVKVFTLYPDLFPGPLDIGIFKKARENKIWNLKVINIREYSKDNHGTVDDTPFGGGSGMLLRPDILASALDKNIEKGEKILIIDDLIATGGTAEAASKLIEISKGKVAAFIFVINLFDLNGTDKLVKKGYKVENLIDFPGH